MSPPVLTRARTSFQQEPCQRQHQGARRNIDVKHRLPAEPRHEEATHGGPGDCSHSHDAEVRAQGLAALRVGERRDHHAHAAALDHAGADSLQHAHHNQHLEAGRKRRAQRCQDENGRAGQIYPASSHNVAQSSHGQQQNADYQRIRDDDPLDRFQRSVEMGLDAGQRDEHAAVVHNRKKRAGSDGPESPPLVGLTGRDALDQIGNRLPRVVTTDGVTIILLLESWRGLTIKETDIRPGGARGREKPSRCPMRPDPARR